MSDYTDIANRIAANIAEAKEKLDRLEGCIIGRGFLVVDSHGRICHVIGDRYGLKLAEPGLHGTAWFSAERARSLANSFNQHYQDDTLRCEVVHVRDYLTKYIESNQEVVDQILEESAARWHETARDQNFHAPMPD